MSKISVTFDVPEELHIRIMRSAKRYYMSRSEWFRRAAREQLEKDWKRPAKEKQP